MGPGGGGLGTRRPELFSLLSARGGGPSSPGRRSVSKSPNQRAFEERRPSELVSPTPMRLLGWWAKVRNGRWSAGVKAFGAVAHAAEPPQAPRSNPKKCLLGGSGDSNASSHSSGGQKPKIQVSAGRAPPEAARETLSRASRLASGGLRRSLASLGLLGVAPRSLPLAFSWAFSLSAGLCPGFSFV